MIAQHIYRWHNRLQAGRSILECGVPLCREGICDPDFTFCHILSGTGCYIDSGEREHRYAPGSFLLRLPGVLHRQTHEAGDVYIDQFIVLPREFAVLLLEWKQCSPEHPVIGYGVSPGVDGQFDRLIAELETAPENQLPLTATGIFRTVCELLQATSVKEPHYHAVMTGAELLTHDEVIPIPEIAAKCGMGNSTFRRLFTGYFGCSPAEYRIRKRIEQIQSLLRTSGLSQKEIAARFGYADVYTFHRQFKRYTGMTPNEFRQK